MDFAQTNEQSEYRQRVMALAKALGQDLPQRDEAQTFDAEGWRRCAEFGLTGLIVPQSYGGAGVDPLTAAIALEALGYGCRDNGLMMALGAHLWGCVQPIALSGTDAQKQLYLPRLSRGGAIGALAATEAGAGSDIGAVETSAVIRDGNYILNGRKIFVTNAPIADLYLVLARLEPRRKQLGLALFLVERNAPGLSVGPAEAKSGLRTAQLGSVSLDECVVAASARLGPEGAGLALFQAAMDWERTFILAPAVGSMARLLEEANAFARSRLQSNAPIASFHNIASRIADSRVRLETARLLLYRSAWQRGAHRGDRAAAAMTKLHISESWVEVCRDVMDIYGGLGYLSATGIERELRDALAGRIYSGTSDIQRSIIARAPFPA